VTAIPAGLLPVQWTPAGTYDSSMGGARVLVVDDDPTVAEVVVAYLRDADFEVDHAADGQTALELFGATPPDLVVLDLMLPGIDGLEVCRRMRDVRETPIIMLTALGAESDRVVGLERGADDYVTKPFSPRELVLRVRSVLRRSGPSSVRDAAGGALSDGDLMVDLPARRVTKAGEELGLTGREFDLLVFFLRNSGIAFSREQLLEQVWGWTFGDQSTVTVHVRRLREKVEPDPGSPQRLVTVWGVGYRWESAA
jgi:two-component system response regulator ResD